MWKDATAMAQAVNQKQVSAKELVQETIDRIEKLNPASMRLSASNMMKP